MAEEKRTWGVIHHGRFDTTLYYRHLTKEEAEQIARQKNADKSVKGVPFRAADLGNDDAAQR